MSCDRRTGRFAIGRRAMTGLAMVPARRPRFTGTPPRDTGRSHSRLVPYVTDYNTANNQALGDGHRKSSAPVDLALTAISAPCQSRRVILAPWYSRYRTWLAGFVPTNFDRVDRPTAGGITIGRQTISWLSSRASATARSSEYCRRGDQRAYLDGKPKNWPTTTPTTNSVPCSH